MTKIRLFLFASYDRDAIIDDYVIYYLAELSKLGDIIFVTDNDNSDAQAKKVKPYTIHQIIGKHGEYDFGSYKRAYFWARDNDLLSKYDWVYLVNDSAYGPTSDLKPIVEKLENSGSDAVGMFMLDYSRPHIQSWFVGLSSSIFLSDWFNEFMKSVKHENHKDLIIEKYEIGLSELIKKHGHKLNPLVKYRLNWPYLNPIWVLNHGVPFVKKAAFYNNDSNFIGSIKNIIGSIKCTNKKLAELIENNLTRTVDPEVIRNFKNRRFQYVFFDLINKSFLSIRGRYKKNGNYRFLIRLFHLPIFYISIPKSIAFKRNK